MSKIIAVMFVPFSHDLLLSKVNLVTLTALVKKIFSNSYRLWLKLSRVQHVACHTSLSLIH